MDAEKYVQARLEFIRRNSTYSLNFGKDYKRPEQEFHCGVEESGGHAYNCNDCPNKCEEWHQWDKEIKQAKDKSKINYDLPMGSWVSNKEKVEHGNAN